MHNTLRKSTVYFLIVAVLMVPMAGRVMAEENYYEKTPISGEAMVADLALVRPVGLLSMITGTVLFVFSLPFSFSEGSMEENRQEMTKNLDKLIVEPSKHTFHRRLGDM